MDNCIMIYIINLETYFRPSFILGWAPASLTLGWA